jgi:hypothetical protein
MQRKASARRTKPPDNRSFQVRVWPADDLAIEVIVDHLKRSGRSDARQADAVRYAIHDCASRIGTPTLTKGPAS